MIDSTRLDAVNDGRGKVLAAGNRVRVTAPMNCERFPGYYRGDGVIEFIQKRSGVLWVHVRGTWDEHEGEEVFPFEWERVRLLYSSTVGDEEHFNELAAARERYGLKPLDGRSTLYTDSGCQGDCGDCACDVIEVVDNQPERHPNSARFHELLTEAGDLHDIKQADYGRDDDPFANVRGSSEWGMPAWVGAMVRAHDKIRRLQTFARKGELRNEAVVDAFMDLAVYALIARVLYEQDAA